MSVTFYQLTDDRHKPIGRVIVEGEEALGTLAVTGQFTH